MMTRAEYIESLRRLNLKVYFMGELIEKLNAMGERVIFLGDGVPVYEKQIAEKA